MTNSLLPKTPLHQETLDRLLVLLRQPFSIAVLASLAAHGLLWAALPNVLDQKEPETQRRVQVVALSPAEQGQLPPLGINPVPQIVPVKPLQPTQSGTKLPDPKYNDSLLSTIPVLPLSPPTFPIDLSNLLPKSLPEPKNETKKQATAPDKTKNPPVPPVNPRASNTNQNPVKPTDTPTAPARVDKLSPEQIAALQTEQRQLRASYTFNGSEPDKGKRIGEILPKSLDAFENAVAAATGGNYDNSSYRKAPETVEIPFPKEACTIAKEPFIKEVQNASVGAYVKPDGKLEGKPGLLLTSGFNGLDQLALDYVNSTPFKTSGKPRLVRFNFVFDPRTVCANATKPT